MAFGFVLIAGLLLFAYWWARRNEGKRRVFVRAVQQRRPMALHEFRNRFYPELSLEIVNRALQVFAQATKLPAGKLLPSDSVADFCASGSVSGANTPHILWPLLLRYGMTHRLHTLDDFVAVQAMIAVAEEQERKERTRHTA